jgi:hypothetical protein
MFFWRRLAPQERLQPRAFNGSPDEIRGAGSHPPGFIQATGAAYAAKIADKSAPT